MPYEFIDWNRWGATLPFKFTFKMPSTDRGKRGYSDKYTEKLAKKIY